MKLALYIWLLFVSVAISATYFIDYSAGDDSNAGTSTGTAWKHCIGDSNAASVPATNGAAAGDVFVFKGGESYAFSNVTDQINWTWSGDEGNPITIRSGHLHDTPWPDSTSRAFIDCNGVDLAARTGILDLNNNSNITVEGFYFHDAFTNKADSAAFIYWEKTSATDEYDFDIYIDDCIMSNSYRCAVMLRASTNSPGIKTGFTITNCTIRQTASHGIHINRMIGQALIVDCDIDQAGAYDPSGLDTVGNPISFGGFGVYYNQQSNIVRSCLLDDSTPSSNKSLILVQNPQIDLIVEDNIFQGSPNVAALDVARSITNLTFRNNLVDVDIRQFEGVFRFRSDQGGLSAECDNLDFHNNTINATPTGDSGIFYFYAANDDDVQFKNVSIQNNIIDTDTATGQELIWIDNTKDASPSSVVEFATLVIDNNAYFSSNATPFYVEDDGGYRTFAQWKTYAATEGATGADSNSIWGEVAWIDEVNSDYTLASSDTNAVDQGTDLSGEGFSDDIDGVTRPQGAAWDIGAYEYFANWWDVWDPASSGLRIEGP